MKLKNAYYIMRHGEALSNVKDIISSWPEKGVFPLTEKGKKQAELSAKELKKENIDLIFSSDVLRTKQTAEIVSYELEIKPTYDKRLREYNVGVFNARPIDEYQGFLKNPKERFEKKPQKGETYKDIIERVMDFLTDTDRKYTNKKILIISHQIPLTFIEAKIKDIDDLDIFRVYTSDKLIKTGQFRRIN
ncbi:MAG: histidine phosphatase family protein [Candidatus Pacebacteria bacterium]|nr:histidine phosphatase family protein [Candidatus Paceibacterota bacterium]